MKPETRLVTGSGHDVAPPLARTTTFDRAEGPYVYQRNANPTVEEAERVLGELEGGHAVRYPSGTAAVVGVLLALLEPGARVAVPQEAYWGTAVLLDTELARWGLHGVPFAKTGAAPGGVQAVLLEAPSNPLLTF